MVCEKKSSVKAEQRERTTENEDSGREGGEKAVPMSLKKKVSLRARVEKKKKASQ